VSTRLSGVDELLTAREMHEPEVRLEPCTCVGRHVVEDLIYERHAGTPHGSCITRKVIAAPRAPSNPFT
jgi:hypothetical protein